MDKPEGNNSKEWWSFGETFERVWGQALVAVSAAEDEAGKVAQRVAELAGWSQDEVKRHVRDFTERLIVQRRDMEKAVEESVKRSLARLKVPRREDLETARERLDALAKRIEALTSKE